MSGIKEKIKKNIPLAARIVFCLTVLAALVHIVSLISEDFADLYVRYPGAFVRGVLAKITGVFPFSVAELVVITIPVWLFMIIMISRKAFKKGDTASSRFVWGTVAVVAALYSLFVLGFGMGYHGTPLASKLGLEEVPVTPEELESTASRLSEDASKELDEIVFSSSGRSYMGYSVKELNSKLNDAYEKACKKYGFIPDLRSNVKTVAFSDAVAYTHISGLYSYYTGEANVVTAFPDYSLPFTMAHEMAHQRGFAPEEEANFVAFLVCMESDDPYIRYSGYINVFEYVMSALGNASSEKVSSVYFSVDIRIRRELIDGYRATEKYRGSTAGKVADKVNDTTLKLNGQEAGSDSYGLVVDLAVAYYKAQADK